MAYINNFRHFHLGCFVRDNQFLGFNKLPIFASNTKGFAASGADHIDDLFVDRGTQYHLNHVHGFAVSHAHTINKFRFD